MRRFALENVSWKTQDLSLRFLIFLNALHILQPFQSLHHLIGVFATDEPQTPASQSDNQNLAIKQ